MQIKRNLYHSLKTLIQNVFLLNFAYELLMSLNVIHQCLNVIHQTNERIKVDNLVFS